ncbi:GntR family transcriptional regulator [Herbaspirillum sp. C7C8]|uniref:GntR family transcriptional regulator n=1 Tax=Herbaspirillum sp. C7C8 TaxID=2736665 RepID=UPI001F5218F8|nr:GntR family transcriptional regulator [Herbaspirillum sp. C7C8]MCI1007366.1 GntR family transcriptional regulator [Herbaspirillum sp. C7C8]
MKYPSVINVICDLYFMNNNAHRRLRRQPLTTKAIFDIRELLLTGQLPPGRKISEPWLASKLQISRTPIRAALAVIYEEGLIDSAPSGGYLTRQFSSSDISDTVDLRGTIQGWAARLAAERGISSTGRLQLESAVRDIDNLLLEEISDDTLKRFAQLNEQLHKLLVNVTESEVVKREAGRVQMLPFSETSAFFNRNLSLDWRHRLAQMCQIQHHAILEAVFSREGTRAEALLREHARLTVTAIQEIFLQK